MKMITTGAIFVLLAASVLTFAFWKIRQLNRAQHWQKEFINKYVEGQTHPVFGEIKGYGSGWGFRHTLPTPGLKTSEMWITFEEDPNETHAANFTALKTHWEDAWPLIFESIREKAADYGYLDTLQTSGQSSASDAGRSILSRLSMVF